MAYSYFEKLEAPLIPHIWQVLTYMLALKHDPRIPKKINENVGLIYYISKAESKKEFPIKAFKIPMDNRIKGHIIEKLRQFKEGYENYPDMLPPMLQACRDSNWNTYVANTCPCIQECSQFAQKGL
jgi:hypothetical protein